MSNRIDAFIGWMDEWQKKRTTPEPTADDGGDCGPYEGAYEAAIRMSPQLCALCHKEIQRGFARYWRDKLLHQECLIPFITAQRMNPEHRFEEEA